MSGLDRPNRTGPGRYPAQPDDRPPGGQPRLLKVRLLGAEADCAAAADQLAAWTLERSAPYPNRRDPGVRVYLTLHIPAPGTSPAGRP